MSVTTANRSVVLENVNVTGIIAVDAVSIVSSGKVEKFRNTNLDDVTIRQRVKKVAEGAKLSLIGGNKFNNDKYS